MQYLFDETYLQALKEGDPQVANHLLYLFDGKVRMRLRMRLHSPETVEDATQETLLRILTYFRTGKTLRAPCTLPSFVNAVCMNVSLEMLRAGSHQRNLPDTIPDPVDFRDDPECSALARERRQIVRRALCDLREKDQRLLHRVFLEEADKDQVCREFKTNRGQLRVLLHRARLRFKAALQKSTVLAGRK
jgi:RNA polymerase sigma-70 factor (ECF subfamily)